MRTDDLQLALRGALSVIGDRLEHFTRLMRATQDAEDASEYLIAGVEAMRPLIDKAIELAKTLKQRRANGPGRARAAPRVRVPGRRGRSVKLGSG